MEEYVDVFSDKYTKIEKAQHYMVKMTQCFDDLNSWFTAFGSPEANDSE